MELAKEKKDRFITCEDVLKLKYTNKVSIIIHVNVLLFLVFITTIL